MKGKFKNLWKWFKSSYKVCLIFAVPFFAFFIVNIITYENSRYSLDFSNLSNISFSFQAKKEGIELYFSILTIIGLIIAIYQFISSNKQAETANRQLNASILQTNLTSQNTNSLLKQTQISIQQLEKINKLVVTSNQQLNLSIQQKRTEDELLRKSVVNGLLEGLKHNINLVEGLYYDFDKEKLYRFINDVLVSDNIIFYPMRESKENDSQNNDIQPKLECFASNYTSIPQEKSNGIIKLNTDYLSFVIRFNNYFIKEDKSRIFLNLGHLLWSINCYNLAVDDYNANRKSFFEHQTFKFEVVKKSWISLSYTYYKRLHYRLHFMLIDLIRSFNTEDFVDTDYVKSIKKIIDDEYF